MQVAGAICINKNGEVLLVRGRLGGKWSFPKGHKKRGESDLQCALRELWEETGIIPSSSEPMRSYKLAKATYFFFTIEEECCPRVNDSNEIDQVEWWSLASLPACNSNVDVSMFRSLLKTHPIDIDL
jgi:mRNA-decapping enzyme subunit 2